MKKLFLFIISVSVIFLSFGCTTNNSGITEIDYSNLASKIQNKENFILYVGRATCSHCVSFKPTLESVAKEYGITIYYIDLDKLTDSQKTAVSDKVDLQGTPTVVSIKNGRAENSKNLIGEKEEDAVVDFFMNVGYIK